MKKIIILILLIFTFGCSNSKVNYKKIDNEGLEQVFNEYSEYTIIDVRTFPEYNGGHIEGAINIPVDGINSDTIKNIDKSDAIIVYCQSGNRSKQAASKLIDLGYINVYDLGAISEYDGNIVK